jgi:nitrate reductase gamma subunit
VNQPTIADFQHIFLVIQTVTHDIAIIATGLAGLMIVVAGMFLMFDRDTSHQARMTRMGFIKNVLIAYGIIIAAAFILQLITQAFAAGGIQ